MGEYKPCSFDREEYLRHAVIFEATAIEDVQEELTEFSDDLEGLAFELAYTRYALAKIEKQIERIKEKIKPDHLDGLRGEYPNPYAFIYGEIVELAG